MNHEQILNQAKPLRCGLPPIVVGIGEAQRIRCSRGWFLEWYLRRS
jgi:hypothetical protein